MNCPKCNAPMEPVTFADVTIDRCTACKGLWFDAGEVQRLKAVKGSEKIDTGDPALGARLNKVDTINCPVCHSSMIRMVDIDQPHIWFESCKVCKGAFFDAGEFTDLKHHTLIDYFRDLFSKERK